MLPVLIITLVILFIICLILVFYRPIYLGVEKLFFRSNVARKVYKIAKDNDYYVLNKVAINVMGRTIHFDHLLFGNKYIYCIGVKYYSLAIDGNYKDVSWFNYKTNNKFEYIKNPMRLHRERVEHFCSLVAPTSDLFVATILVNNSCLVGDIKESGKYNKIVRINDFEKLIKEYENDKSVDPIDPILLHKLVLDVFEKGVK